MSNKILIIGGCGYIGSELFTFLKKKSFNIETVDLEWWGNFVNKNNIKKDYNILTKNYLSKFETIIFLAGHSNPNISVKYPFDTFKNNTYNFINLYNKINKNTKFIYASTIGVYGMNDGIVDENFSKFNPLNIYDLSKMTSDFYINLNNNKNYFGLRFGVVNGYSSNFRKDTMLNSMVFNARNYRRITVNNEENIRAVLGMKDLCNAIHVVIKSSNSEYGIYNLCSFNDSIRNIAEKTANYFNVSIDKLPDKKDVYSSEVSSDKFIKKFNFQFKDSIISIIKDINKNYKSMNIIERSPKRYGK